MFAVLGWFIAVMAVKAHGAPEQIGVAAVGFIVALIGVLGVLNGAHLKNAIWKE